MPAAPPGTISLSCNTRTGTFTAVAHFDPDTGTFEPDAFTTSGAGCANLGTVPHDGDPITIVVRAGTPVPAEALAAAGITNWAQVHTLTLLASDLT